MPKIDVATELVQRERTACLKVIEDLRLSQLYSARLWKDRGDEAKRQKHFHAAVMLQTAAEKIEMRAGLDDDGGRV